MKESVRFELERSLRKMDNIQRRASEIQKKIENLEGEAERLKISLEREKKRYFEYGMSSERPQAGKPEWTSERIRKSDSFNSKLRQEKEELFDSYFQGTSSEENITDQFLDMPYFS